MNDLITVFKMEEVSINVRITLLKKLGRAINDEHGANITNELVDELISILEKRNENCKI